MLKKIELTADNVSMIETITKPDARPDVQSIESETVLHGEPELLLPIDEYATRHGVSRRTADRYVKSGRLDSIKQHGRTMIIDKPLKPSTPDTRPSPNDMDVQIVPLARNDFIRLGYLQARSKSKTLWQAYAIVLTVLCVTLLLVSLWLFTQWRFLIETFARP